MSLNRKETYECGELIYELMEGVLIPEYVESLQDNIGSIVDDEYKEGAICQFLNEECVELKEKICEWLNMDVDKGDMQELFDCFYSLLHNITVKTYEVAFLDLRLDSWEDLDNNLIQYQKLYEEMLLIKIKIRGQLNKFQVASLDRIMQNFNKTMVIFLQKANNYGKYFRNLSGSDE